MSCIKNEKRFLGVKYFGDHKWKITRVYKFMSMSENFMTDEVCELCGCKKTNHFVTWNDLLHKGITNEEIQRVSNSTNLYPF